MGLDASRQAKGIHELDVKNDDLANDRGILSNRTRIGQVHRDRRFDK